MQRTYLKMIVSTFMLIYILGLVSATSSNVLSNSGFENNFQDWQTGAWFQTGASQTIDNTVSYNGQKSAKVVIESIAPPYDCGSNGGWITFGHASSAVGNLNTIILDKNTEYELTAYVKTDKDADADKYFPRFNVALFNNQADWNANYGAATCPHTYDPNRRVESTKFFTGVDAGSWEKVSYKFKTNDENVYMRLSLISQMTSQATSGYTVWFDDVSLKKVEKKNNDHNDKKPITECQVGDCENPYSTAKVVTGSVVEQQVDLTIKKQTGVDDSLWKIWLFWLIIALIVLILLIIIVAILRR